MVIRVKGIKKVIAKGITYYYHRKSKKRIEAPYGTQQFVDEVRRLDESLKPRSALPEGVDPKHAKPGTLGALINAYRASPEFLGRAERTKEDYTEVLDYLKPLHEMPLAQLDSAFVYKVRDKAFKKRKRRFANYVVQILSRLHSWGQPRNICVGNPAEKVEHIERPRGMPPKNRRWTDEEIDAVMAVASPEMRVAIAIGLYTGLREGHVIRVTWSSYNGQRFETIDQKTGTPLWIPAHHGLRAILDAAKRRSPIIVVGVRGQPYRDENGFRAMFFKLIRKLRDEGKVATGLTFHGLRHTVGAKLAEAGCDTRDIMAITGHKTEAMVAHYTREADQKRRAVSAIHKLERTADKNGKPGDP